MKNLIPVLLASLLFSSCSLRPTEPLEEDVDLEEPSVDPMPPSSNYETIDFLDQAVLWSSEEVVTQNRSYYNNTAPEYWTQQNQGDYADYIKPMLQIWKVGSFNTTDYKGQSLVVVNQDCDGPCSPGIFRYAVDETKDTWTLLTEYSMEDDENWAGGPQDKEDPLLRIPELSTPETLEVYSNDELLLMNSFARLEANYYRSTDGTQILSITDESFKPIEIADPSFPTYLSYNGCIYGVSPDGILSRYMPLPEIFGSQADVQGRLTEELTLSIDGEELKKEWSLSSGSCGLMFSCLETVNPTEEEEKNMEIVGTLEGRELYLPTTLGPRPEPTQSQSILMKLYSAYDRYLMEETYSSGLEEQDNSEESEEEEKNLENFLAQNTVFFIKLDNGSYVTVTDADYAQGAECGKPVIYLYPQEKTLVNVQVGIEAFTKTIPAYGPKGWFVWAEPSGLLRNVKDGLNYPYLFWEGQSSLTLDAGETWTLEKSEIPGELPKALKNIGLNEQERADFMEFWTEKLLAVNEPFVEFAFVNEDLMDQIAPLHIHPTPDQVIRIFMYYRGVVKAGVPMPDYHPAARYGFTVVEWGGSLY